MPVLEKIIYGFHVVLDFHTDCLQSSFHIIVKLINKKVIDPIVNINPQFNYTCCRRRLIALLVSKRRCQIGIYNKHIFINTTQYLPRR